MNARPASCLVYLLAAAFAAVAGSGCAPKEHAGPSRIDLARVERLAAGGLVADMDLDRMGSFDRLQDLGKSSSPAIEPALPCAGLETPKADPEASRALSRLGACLRGLSAPYRVVDAAIQHFRNFSPDDASPELSSLSERELLDWIGPRQLSPAELFGRAGDPRRERLRSSFSDAELEELSRLGERRARAIEAASAEIARAVLARADWIDSLAASRVPAQSVSRYRLLLSMARATDPAALLADLGLEKPKQARESSQIKNVALVAWVPRAGEELRPVDLAQADPWTLQGFLDAEIGTAETRRAYVAERKRDNPPRSARPFASRAVRVAFVDTGADFVRYPDLGAYLGSSLDLADGDANPWLPAIGSLAHGSGTLATLLTVVARQAPETLLDRRLELSMWKTYALRELLSGARSDSSGWDNRLAIQSALLEAGREPRDRAPQVVSVSLGAETEPYLARVGNGDAIRRAPWLWVMASGNSGVAVEKEPVPSCFADIPQESRNDARILCVGALVRDRASGELRVAGYSNYGPRVEIYAPDAIEGTCPGGTSCATPVISAAAALVLARDPSLSPEQVKRVLVAASVERDVPIDLATTSPGLRLLIERGLAPKTRRVRVFDPEKAFDQLKAY